MASMWWWVVLGTGCSDATKTEPAMSARAGLARVRNADPLTFVLDLKGQAER